ncbi:carbohydrate-binding module family 21 protein [Karstenula rhodostoma CBS 690.94]|uniref:Carbohydrate-binding module family 21 protein n=1 Tax=Karstenula rhodostoma CBS 690.94 TaxID=1392251 RepID=A0A9P4UFK9_9PLEO|nr:carbohydrate-binding module family 21 protein [Karstenula rhodostoma CBS 690.94]
MPYTPPSHTRSPATSNPSSPILSRNHSYADQFPLPSAGVHKPALPRSHSTSYLVKHRRSSASSNANNAAAAANTQANSITPSPDVSRAHGPSAHGSLRPSPPPVNNSLIPSGAITTPPDSSDDDEDRGRDIGSLRELQEALQHIPVKRQSSPNRGGVVDAQVNSAASNTAARPLSADARKISHSRSSSEIMLSKHVSLDTDTSVVISSSEGSDAEDDELRIKPPLLRKKSGELVKPALRPASRRRPSSMPGTPTYSKAVHFNEEIEQVRHFLQVDRPIAVSAGSSPVETYESEGEYPFFEDHKVKEPEWEIKLANLPSADTYERQTMPVRVERIFLASDNKTLVGTVACANIAFQKVVVARFTLDYWKTTSEVVAEYNHDVRKKQKDDGYDRFNFNIKLADQANLESKTLLLCVRYQANGQEFWDNNNSMNYQVDFTKKAQPLPNKRSSGPVHHAIPRSRHSPTGPRPRSMPAGSFDDDFGQEFGSKFAFGPSRPQLRASSSGTIRLKPRKRSNLFVNQTADRQPAGQAFSTRYDFSASLSAALSNAQTALGDRSGLTPNDTNKPSKDYFAKDTASKVSAAPVPGTRPGGLSSEKPDLQSAEYNELIQKFCFFGTPSKGSPNGGTPAAKNSHTDGATEYILNAQSASGSNTSSATNSPPSPSLPVLVDGANDSGFRSASRSPFLSRSTSPGPVTGSAPEDHMASTLQYGYSMHRGIFSEQNHTPQACV